MPTVAELREEATKLGIEVPKRAKKADLEEMIAEAEANPTLAVLGARMRALSVFGAFGSRTLVEMPTEIAMQVFPKGIAAASRTEALEAVERELAEIEKRAPDLAESATAAVARTMAYELEDPYNSATSKSMCARQLREAMDRLHELAPEGEEADALDDLSARRHARRKAA